MILEPLQQKQKINETYQLKKTTALEHGRELSGSWLALAYNRYIRGVFHQKFSLLVCFDLCNSEECE